MTSPADQPSESSSGSPSDAVRRVWSPAASGTVHRFPRCHHVAPRSLDVSGLDDDEVAALRLIAQGLLLDDVARRLGISERTLRRRIRALCERLGVRTPVEAIVWAAHHGVV